MASPPPRSDVTLYYDTLSASTLRVTTALHEKQVDFDKKPLDPSTGENLQTWFLQISPTGGLPVLRHKVGIEMKQCLPSAIHIKHQTIFVGLPHCRWRN